MRRVLIVTGDFRLGGGMDRANLALADHLARDGAEVRLVAHHVDRPLVERPGVTARIVPRPLGSHLLGAPLLDRAGRTESRRLQPAGGRVVVNGGNCLVGDVNWVHYVHAAFEPGTNRKSPLRRFKDGLARRRALNHESRALRAARLVIANSERTRTDLIDRTGVAPDRIAVVYYGIDPERFGAITPEERSTARRDLDWDPARPVLVFVGALGDRRKGFDTLFEAVRQLHEGRTSWDADLVVVGSGADAPSWKRRAVDNGLGARIRFLGRRDDVPRILAASDALVHPARYEAYGLGVQEALARGLPALVTASSGVAERYPEALRSLLIDDPDDPEALATRLLHWRADMDSLRDAVESFAPTLRARTWDAMAREFEDRVDATRSD